MTRISLARLRAMVPNLPADVEDVKALIEEAGRTIERVITLREAIAPVVAARVLEARRHPNADTLWLCRVFDGEGERQIVCGAPVVEEGAVYPLIRPGDTLPTGQKLRAAKLRGEVSEGMLCSPRELEVADEAAGLLELPADTEPGTSAAELIHVEGAVFEIQGKRTPEEIAAAVAVAID